MVAAVLKRTALVLALALAACLTPVDPEAGDMGQLRVRPQYAAGEEPVTLRLQVDSAAVVADPEPDPDAPAVDARVALPAPDESLDWLVEVTGDAAVYHVRLSLIGDGRTLYQGEADVSVPTGAVQPGQVHDVLVRYIGPPRAASIAVTPGTTTLEALGATASLSATAIGHDGAELEGKTFVWTSSAPDIATVDAAGVVTAVAEGDAVISATTDDLAGDATVTVAVRAASGRSTIESDAASLTADGVTAAIITVRLFDANGHPVAQSGGTVALAATIGNLGPVTDHQDGTYTAALASSVAGTASLTGTLNGEPIEDDAQITFVAGPAAPGSATISAQPVEVEANGSAASTVTVRLFDANGNPLTQSGGTVALATTLGGLSAVTDHDDGTYTAELRSTDVGPAVVTGTLDGQPLTDDAQVLFVAGPAAPGSATISAQPTEVEANGADAAVVTVRLFDAGGNPLATSGGTVVLATTLGTLGAVTDHNDGTYTAELRSTDVGPAVVTGTLDGQPITDDAQVLFVAGPAAPGSATLTAQPVEVEANGSDASIVTVRLFDSNGNPLTQSGGAVVLATTLGTLTAVVDLGDGTYTAQLRSTEVGPAVVTGTLNGAPIADDAQVLFTAVDRTVATVEVQPGTATLSAIGARQQFSAVARNAAGTTIPDVTFTWSTGDDGVATVDPATGLSEAVGNGGVTITATADGIPGTATLTVRQRVAQLTLARFCPGGAEAGSTGSGAQALGCDTLSALGDQVQILAQAVDANGHPVAAPGITWATDAPAVATVEPGGLVTAVGNGTAVITATADDATAAIEVVVRQAVASLTVEPSAVSLAVGAQAQLAARAFDATGHLVGDAVFTWTALDPAVAQVDGNGLVTAMSIGSTTIRVTAQGLQAEAGVVVQ